MAGKPQWEQGQISSEEWSTPIQDAAGRLLEGMSDCAPREMTVRVRKHSTEPGL